MKVFRENEAQKFLHHEGFMNSIKLHSSSIRTSRENMFYFYLYLYFYDLCVSSLFLQVADSDSEHYTALQSSTKNTKRTRRHDEKVYTHVVYSSITLSNLCT